MGNHSRKFKEDELNEFPSCTLKNCMINGRDGSEFESKNRKIGKQELFRFYDLLTKFSYF